MYSDAPLPVTDAPPPSSAWARYHRATRTATYGFLSALPLLLAYEVLIVAVNRGAQAQVRVGAEVWLKELFAVFGTAGHLAMGGVLVVVGLGIMWRERELQIPLRSRYFGWLVAESAGYAVVVALFVSVLVGALFAAAPVAGQLSEQGMATQLALSIGAGLYEELVFRVLLVGGLYVGLRRLWPGRGQAYAVAAVVGAVLFSAVHYVGAFGDVFTLASFAFRFFFGLALNVLFLWRGFGVAAWTHALYDVMVVTRLL